jgi:hypothetical protein
MDREITQVVADWLDQEMSAEYSVDFSDVVILWRASKRRGFRGLAYNGIPKSERTRRINGVNYYIKMMMPPHTFPYTFIQKGKGVTGNQWTVNSAEEFVVYLLAHEMRHIVQYKRMERHLLMELAPTWESQHRLSQFRKLMSEPLDMAATTG